MIQIEVDPRDTSAGGQITSGSPPLNQLQGCSKFCAVMDMNPLKNPGAANLQTTKITSDKDLLYIVLFRQ